MREMKKAAALVLCAAMLLCFVPTAGAASVTAGVCGENLTWALDGETLVISGTGRMYDYECWDEYGFWDYYDDEDNYDFRYDYYYYDWDDNHVNDTAPWQGLYFTKVEIGAGVTSIGDFAFFECCELTSINIPAGIRSVGTAAFGMCDEVNITVDSDNPYYTAVNGVLFNKDKTELVAYAKNSASSYSVPSGVTTVADGAFYGCYGLEKVTISSGVTTIGREAFALCEALTSISLPSSVTSVGAGAFAGCQSLESITLPTSLTSIGMDAFLDTAYYDDDSNWDDDGVLYIGKYLISGYPEGDYTIKSGTLAIADCALVECDMLESVTVPTSVKTIGNSAFAGCYGMTSATIKSGATSIGEGAFYECYALESVTIPSSVKTIGDYAFFYCESLTSISMPGATTIGDEAFAECQSLESITLPTTLTSIGSCAFVGTAYYDDYDNWDNDEVLYIGKYLIEGYVDGDYTVKSGTLAIADAAFFEIPITGVTIPASVKTIGNYAFEGCADMTSVTIKSGATSIGEGAFAECWGLESVTIPSSVKTIGAGAFFACEWISSVSLSGVTEIGDWAFAYCDELASVSLSSSLTNIGSEAFRRCSALDEVTIPANVSSIGAGAFAYCNADITVNTKNSYYSATNGILFNKSKTELVAYMKSDSSYTVPDGVETICDYAFGRNRLTSVTIPDSVTSIGYGAFAECERLEEVNYGGTGDDWENIAIDSKNYNLLNANIYPSDYVYEGDYYFTITSISSNGTVIVTKNAAEEGGVLAVAKYCDGILTGIKLTDLGDLGVRETLEVKTGLSAGTNETLKAFVWKELGNETPLSDVALYE